MSDNKYPSWCCQRCGDRIGYLGRFVEILYMPFLWLSKSVFHNCPGLFTLPAKKIAECESDERSNNFPIFGGIDSAIKEQREYSRTNKQENHNPCNT